MSTQTLNETTKKMSQAIDHLKHELQAIRTSRANPNMLDSVSVEVYGTAMRLKDLASISTPEPRALLITPFDANNVHAVAKGVEKANLGVQPTVDGSVVRIKIPEMDASVRDQMCKLARKKCEEAKVSIRNARRDGNEEGKKEKNASAISEDLLKRLEKQIQDATDKHCKTADALTSTKEKEIVTV